MLYLFKTFKMGLFGKENPKHLVFDIDKSKELSAVLLISKYLECMKKYIH
jgi:hypothetical protein